MVEEGKGWRESAKEEDLQLGGFIHRVSGHHSEKDWGLFCGSRCARYLVRGKEYQMDQDGESQSHSQSYLFAQGSSLALVAGNAVGLLFAGKSNMAINRIHRQFSMKASIQGVSINVATQIAGWFISWKIL